MSWSPGGSRKPVVKHEHARETALWSSDKPVRICGPASDTSGVERVLERLAGAEARRLGGFDHDLFAGLRIAAFAAGAGRNNEYAKAGNANFVAGFQGLGDHLEDAVNGLLGVHFR